MLILSFPTRSREALHINATYCSICRWGQENKYRFTLFSTDNCSTNTKLNPSGTETGHKRQSVRACRFHFYFFYFVFLFFYFIFFFTFFIFSAGSRWNRIKDVDITTHGFVILKRDKCIGQRLQPIKITKREFYVNIFFLVLKKSRLFVLSVRLSIRRLNTLQRGKIPSKGATYRVYTGRRRYNLTNVYLSDSNVNCVHIYLLYYRKPGWYLPFLT